VNLQFDHNVNITFPQLDFIVQAAQSIVTQLYRIEGKVDKMNADFQAFADDVKAKFTGIKTNLDKIAADETSLLAKITELQNSTSLSDADKAALAEIQTLGQSVLDQTTAIDSNVPDAPSGNNGGGDV
jgi:hypothetical protein